MEFVAAGGVGSPAVVGGCFCRYPMSHRYTLWKGRRGGEGRGGEGGGGKGGGGEGGERRRRGGRQEGMERGAI